MNDPTKLENVLNALQKTPKGRLRYPYAASPQPLGKEKDLCVLKYMVDANGVSFSPEFSFQSQTSSLSTDDDDDDKENIHPLPLDISIKEEETPYEPEDWKLGNIANHYQQVKTQNITLQLEEEFANTLKLSCSKKNQEYISTLTAIRQAADDRLKEVLLQEQLIRDAEQKRREQFQEDVQKEISNRAEEYKKMVEKRKSILVEEVEAAKRKEEEQIQCKAQLDQLAVNLAEFTEKLLAIKTKLAELNGDVGLDNNIEETLLTTLHETEAYLAIAEEGDLVAQDIEAYESAIKYAMEMAASIQQVINSKEIAEEEAQKKKSEEQAKLAEEKLKKEKDEADQAALQKITVKAEPVEQKPEVATPPHILEAEKKFNELKNILNQVVTDSKSVKEDKNMCLPLAKAVGLINQLNNDRQDSNRSKLQQIMNLISGKMCAVGEQSISVNNNPAALAFVKDQLSSKIVNLGHDKQVTSMAVYASLTVKIWQSYPDVGQLILLRLYEICPYLIPLRIPSPQNITSEEYNRLQGFRHKDGASCEALDKFLTRMGAAAEFYGRIICMEVSTGTHPHGIMEGWRWLASVLSMPPHKVGTAAVLQGFLNIAGNAFLKQFGKQFQKLLLFIITRYIPLLEKETIEGGYSDIASLKRIIENFQKNGTIAAPPETYRSII